MNNETIYANGIYRFDMCSMDNTNRNIEKRLIKRELSYKYVISTIKFKF